MFMGCDFVTDSHGGNVYNKKIKIDFSANINPLGMPECVKSAFISSLYSCEKYPDHNCTELKKSIAEHENCSADLICVGNGAADLIYRIVHALKPKKGILVSPCFSEYEKALNEINCNISYYSLKEEKNFDLQSDFTDMIDNETDIIFLTSPNNPTGRIIPNDIMNSTAEKCRKTKTIIVADECFMDFTENGYSYSIRNYMNENIIILKAFTKIYAMAGIRLGYAICGDHIKAKKISETGQFWSISAVAQQCGIAALNEKEYINKTIELITEERHFLESELERLGFKIYHSFSNFIFFRSEIKLCKQLIEKHILIRNCGNYHGISDNYYRIAVRTHNENVELIKIMEMIVNG